LGNRSLLVSRRAVGQPQLRRSFAAPAVSAARRPARDRATRPGSRVDGLRRATYRSRN